MMGTSDRYTGRGKRRCIHSHATVTVNSGADACRCRTVVSGALRCSDAAPAMPHFDRMRQRHGHQPVAQVGEHLVEHHEAAERRHGAHHILQWHGGKFGPHRPKQQQHCARAAWVAEARHPPLRARTIASHGNQDVEAREGDGVDRGATKQDAVDDRAHARKQVPHAHSHDRLRGSVLASLRSARPQWQRARLGCRPDLLRRKVAHGHLGREP